MKKIRVVELFAGVGGFRLGLEGDKNGNSSSSNYTKKLKSNYKIVWSNQWEPSSKVQHANKVYENYWKKNNHNGDDINKVANPDFSNKKVDTNIPDHELLVGGFPCQDYSVAGVNTDGIKGKKGVLWWNIYKILNAKRPPYVLLENVDRLLKSPTRMRGRDFAIILKTMSDLNYDVEWRVINAADYNMPQRRRRVFIIGYNRKSKIKIKNPLKWIKEESPIALGFPMKEKQNQLKIFNGYNFELKNSLEDISNNYSEGKFLNCGIIHKEKVYMLDFITKKNNYKYSQFKNLVDVLETSLTEIPKSFIVDNKEKLSKEIKINQKVGAKLSYLKLIDKSYVLLKTKLDKWKYLKGKKEEERTSKNGIFYYTEGSMKLCDSLELPSRTIITSEGGPGPSRFKHLIEIEKDKTYRRLFPIELERLNMFPSNHTLHNDISDSKRAFFMGNALVVGIIEKIGIELSKKLNF